MQLGDKNLVVQLSCANARNNVAQNTFPQIQVAGIDLSHGAGPPTEVLCLMNMVTEEELKDDEEYEGIFGFSLFKTSVIIWFLSNCVLVLVVK